MKWSKSKKEHAKQEEIELGVDFSLPGMDMSKIIASYPIIIREGSTKPRKPRK